MSHCLNPLHAGIKNGHLEINVCIVLKIVNLGQFLLELSIGLETNQLVRSRSGPNIKSHRNVTYNGFCKSTATVVYPENEMGKCSNVP